MRDAKELRAPQTLANAAKRADFKQRRHKMRQGKRHTKSLQQQAEALKQQRQRLAALERQRLRQGNNTSALMKQLARGVPEQVKSSEAWDLDEESTGGISEPFFVIHQGE